MVQKINSTFDVKPSGSIDKAIVSEWNSAKIAKVAAIASLVLVAAIGLKFYLTDDRPCQYRVKCDLPNLEEAWFACKGTEPLKDHAEVVERCLKNNQTFQMPTSCPNFQVACFKERIL